MNPDYQAMMAQALMGANPQSKALNGQDPVTSAGQNFMTGNGTIFQNAGMLNNQPGQMQQPQMQQQQMAYPQAISQGF